MKDRIRKFKKTMWCRIYGHSMVLGADTVYYWYCSKCRRRFGDMKS